MRRWRRREKEGEEETGEEDGGERGGDIGRRRRVDNNMKIKHRDYYQYTYFNLLNNRSMMFYE